MFLGTPAQERLFWVVQRLGGCVGMALLLAPLRDVSFQAVLTPACSDQGWPVRPLRHS